MYLSLVVKDSEFQQPSNLTNATNHLVLKFTLFCHHANPLSLLHMHSSLLFHKPLSLRSSPSPVPPALTSLLTPVVTLSQTQSHTVYTFIDNSVSLSSTPFGPGYWLLITPRHLTIGGSQALLSTLIEYCASTFCWFQTDMTCATIIICLSAC